MVNEYSSHEVFGALGDQAVACGFGDAMRTKCLRFAEEERVHGVICGAAVVAFGEQAVSPQRPKALFPQHESVPRRARLLRNIISVCCMSETVAVALIGAEQIEMPDSPLRELLTRIYADEIGHARFGWQVMHDVCTSLHADERDAVDRYLPVAFAHLEAHELAHLPSVGGPIGGEAYGLCSGLDARALLYDTIEQVIVPQLAAIGFRAADAWRGRVSTTA
jgi:hypothetical protein